jgi:choline dehydrogenase
MGPAEDSLAVVDQRLKVHGMENLWVADASIMPTFPHANTNLAAIMIGEVVADVIRAERRE